MHVRKSPITSSAGSRPTVAAAAGSAARVAGASEPDSMLADREAGATDARALLAKLRSTPRLTFGGKLVNERTVPFAELLSFLPSVDLARALFRQDRKLSPTIADFLAASMPGDLLQICRDAAEAPQMLPEGSFSAGPTEAAKELGNAVVKNEKQWARLRADLRAGTLAPPFDELKLNDESVRRVFADWGGLRPILDETPPVSGPILVPLLRLLARGIELQVARMEPFDLSLGAGPLPIGPEAASVARRLADALLQDRDGRIRGIEPLHPAPQDPASGLGHWPGFFASLPLASPAVYPLAPTAPLGSNQIGAIRAPRPSNRATDSFPFAALGSVPPKIAQIAERIAKGDPAACQITDEALAELAPHWSSLTERFGITGFTEKGAVGLLRMLERAVDRGFLKQALVGNWIGLGWAGPELTPEVARLTALCEAREALAGHAAPDLTHDFVLRDVPAENVHHYFAVQALMTGADAPLVTRRLGSADRALNTPAPSSDQPRLEALHRDLDLLDPLVSIEARAEALCNLLGGEPSMRHELDELIAAALPRLQNGTLQRIDVNSLPSQAKRSVVRALSEWDHPAAMAILCGLFMDVPETLLRTAFAHRGAGEEFARKFALTAARFSRLEPRDLALALSIEPMPGRDWMPVREARPARPMREILSVGELLSGALTPDDLAAAWADLSPLPAGRVIEMLAFVATHHSDPEAARAIGAFLEAKVRSGAIRGEVLEAVMPPDLFLKLRPDLWEELLGVLGRFEEKTLTAGQAARDILKAIEPHRGLVSPSAILKRAIERVHGRELDQVTALKTISALAEPEPPAALGATPHGIRRMLGFTLAVDARPDRDLSAVPSERDAALVLTQATRENLRKVLPLWGKVPFVIEGPPGSSKTSVVRLVSAVIGSPLRRFQCSPETSIADLVGRIVGGLPPEQRTPEARLRSEAAGELQGRLKDFGVEVDAAWDRDRLARLVMDVEAHARWVDGPLTLAMKRGEALCCDEFDLLPAPVRLRLNAIADNPRRFVVQENGGEAVEVDPRFVICGTQNGATANRSQVEASGASRFVKVSFRAYDVEDYMEILRARYGDAIPIEVRAPIATSHKAIADLADLDQLERTSGGVTFSPRQLIQVAERYQRLDKKLLTGSELALREMQEVYRDWLKDASDREVVGNILRMAFKAKTTDFYAGLKVHGDDASWTVGDVTVPRFSAGRPGVPELEHPYAYSPKSTESLYRYLKSRAMGENALLIGSPGSGKNMAVDEVAAQLRQPLFTVYGGADTDVGQLIGEYGPRGWQDGQAVRAFKDQGVLALHELNGMDPQVAEILNPALDDERAVRVDQHEGEVVRVPKESHIVATINDAELGGGRFRLSRSLKNRFLPIRLPDPDAEQHRTMAREAAKAFGVAEPIADAAAETHLKVVDHWAGRSKRERPVLGPRQLKACLKLVSLLQGQVMTKEAGVREAALLAGNYRAEVSAQDAYWTAACAIYAGGCANLEDEKAIRKIIEEAAK